MTYHLVHDYFKSEVGVRCFVRHLHPPVLTPHIQKTYIYVDINLVWGVMYRCVVQW